jgi:hypothetical protein
MILGINVCVLHIFMIYLHPNISNLSSRGENISISTYNTLIIDNSIFLSGKYFFSLHPSCGSSGLSLDVVSNTFP